MRKNHDGTGREFIDAVPIGAPVKPIDAVRFRATGRRVPVAPGTGGAPFSGTVNGGAYRMATAPGKRSVCGYRIGDAATLCGIAAGGEDDGPGLELGEGVWQATRDAMPDDYRPCADCAAAYKKLPAASRVKIKWEDRPVFNPESGEVETKTIAVRVRTSDGLTERLPEPMDRHGATPRDAERDGRLSARLGRIVPLLSVDENRHVTAESLWTLAGKSIHAGIPHPTERGALLLVCRDDAIKGKAVNPDEQKARLTCAACKNLLYRNGRMSIRMMGLVNRDASDPDRFRPAWGLGERSGGTLDGNGRFVRPEHEGLKRAARAQGATMLPGAGVADRPRPRASLDVTEVREGLRIALTGHTREALGAVVRNADGSLWCPDDSDCTHGMRRFHDGWEFLAETGKLPDRIFRTLPRRDKDAIRRGLGYIRKQDAAKRAAERERQQRGRVAEARRQYEAAAHPRNGAADRVTRPAGSGDNYAHGVGRIDAKPAVATKLGPLYRELRGESR